MKKKFAAFDIDGTIARNSLFFQIVDELIAQGHIPSKARKELDDLYAKYQKRSHPLAFAEYSQRSVDILFANIHTLSSVNYRKAVDAVISRSGDHVYTYTRDLVHKLKSEGYFLIALSGSELYAVERFTESFGFDLAIGERYEEKDGHLTGNSEEIFKKKDVFLKKFVEEHDLTYKDSYAVGDSLADAKMLKLVDNPIAFNPEDRLYEKAIEQGWKIVVERKSVIYELEEKSGSYILA
jgi:HAD superfamily hydrolase (TIGR01490 family)